MIIMADLTQSQSEDGEQDERIIQMQNLIEKNIEIEQQIESNSIHESLSAIENIICKANDLVKGYEERRTNATELVLDTELLRRNHDVVAKAIQYNSNITDQMFTTAIRNLVFKETHEDWDALGNLAIQHGNILYTNDSMLPFIDVKPKEHTPKQRTQRKTKTYVEEKRPEKTDKLERKDEGSNAVINIFKQIKQIYREGKRQPIPYFKLIINPHNFMDTVQNALQVSFLIKENCISLENGDDGLPQIHVFDSNNQEMSEESEQAICRLDVKFCEKMAKLYNIKEPMLKRSDEPDI